MIHTRPKYGNLLWLCLKLKGGEEFDAAIDNDLLALQKQLSEGHITVALGSGRGASRVRKTFCLDDLERLEVLGAVGVGRHPK